MDFLLLDFAVTISLEVTNKPSSILYPIYSKKISLLIDRCNQRDRERDQCFYCGSILNE